MESLRNHAVSAEVAKSESQDAKTAQKGGSISDWIPVNGHIPSIGVDAQVCNTIVNTEKGSVTTVLEVTDYFYLFPVRDKKPEVKNPFTTVKSEVEFDYRRFSEEKAAQALLERTLEHQEVEIYDSKFP